jgi:hypothetical protein
MQDYGAFIDSWKKAKAEILVGSPIPPDFTVLWRQCKQMGFYPKIATIGKACLFPSAVEALGGDLPLGITTEVWWTPSILTGLPCRVISPAAGEAWTARPRAVDPASGLGIRPDRVVATAQGAASLTWSDSGASPEGHETVFGHIKFIPTTTPRLAGRGRGSRANVPWDRRIVYNCARRFRLPGNDLPFPRFASVRPSSEGGGRGHDFDKREDQIIDRRGV